MKPEQWIVNGEVGTSSRTIWAVMMGAVTDKDVFGVYGVPHDPDDFRRCYLLLEAIPEWRGQLSEVEKIFPMWIGFVREWDKLTEMYEKAVKTGTGKAPEMFELMQKLEDEGRIADGWIQTSRTGWKKEKNPV